MLHYFHYQTGLGYIKLSLEGKNKHTLLNMCLAPFSDKTMTKISRLKELVIYLKMSAGVL